jgi:CHASE2 domain-containing sensor protein
MSLFPRAWLKRDSRLWKIVSLLIVTAAVDLVVEAADPFGMVEAVKEKAADMLQLAGSMTDSTSGQDAVTVVLIDPRYFETVGRRPVWPMPVNALTMGVISRILDAKPRALFIDIAFPDAPREIVYEGRNTRAEALTALADGLAALGRLNPDIPIFLGDDLSPGDDLEAERLRCGVDYIPTGSVRAHSVLPEALLGGLFRRKAAGANGVPDKAAGDIEIVDASWAGESTTYPLAPSLTGLRGACRNLRADHSGYVASPALALFSAYMRGCDGAHDRVCALDHVKALATAAHAADRVLPVDRDGLRPRRLDPPAQGTVALRWGVTLTPARRRLYRGSAGSDRCLEQFGGSAGSWVKNYLLHVLGPIQRRFGEPTQRRCVYVDTISAGELVGAPRGGAAADRDVAGTFLTGRAVLLGVDLPQASDRFHSPINGDVPGVYMHAVATENLLSFGDRYPSVGTGVPALALTFLVGAIAAAIMTSAWLSLCEWLGRRARGWGRHVLAPLAYAVVLFGIGTIAIRGLWWTASSLPLGELAMPFIVLHFILFSGMAKNWEEGLTAWLSGKTRKPSRRRPKRPARPAKV